jgi:hypothetical protein
MITDPIRFSERHRQICELAERDYLDQRKKNPKFTVGLAVKAYAVAVRCAIVKRDLIAAVYAAQAAHIVRKIRVGCTRQVGTGAPTLSPWRNDSPTS